MPNISDPFTKAGRALSGGGGSTTPTTQFRAPGQRTKPIYVKDTPAPSRKSPKLAKRKGPKDTSATDTLAIRFGKRSNTPHRSSKRGKRK